MSQSCVSIELRNSVAKRLPSIWKMSLAEAHVPFEVPRKNELAIRLSSVLDVIYLVFKEGNSATAGEDWAQRARARSSAGARGGVFARIGVLRKSSRVERSRHYSRLPRLALLAVRAAHVRSGIMPTQSGAGWNPF